ncbi:TolC family protein [Terriglobus sp.]|uniref:TolC family protein n=1 Tax=Terriglobus sp. TaxID=1889013 RepID=UPI003B0091D7
MHNATEASGCCRLLGKVTIALAMTAALAMPGRSQTQGQSGNGTSQGSSGGGQQASGPATVQAAQQTLNGLNGGSNVQAGGSAASQNDYRGSIVQGKATAGILDLSLDDAIGRGLRNNLGLILNASAVQNAGGTRLQQLQSLLPTVTGNANYTVQQINLAAYGLNFPGFNPIVGPFQTLDFRAYLSQSLLNLQSIDRYLASKHNLTGAKLSAEDARNMVVLTVGNAYLLCIADASRITAEEAILAQTKVSLDQATAAHEAGTSPRLDVLRAQVDYQNAQQQLVQARNGLEKDKLALARAIGLPTEQQFRLTDPVPYAEADAVTPEQAFAQALANRKDLQGMAENVKGSELQKKAAVAEQYPTIDFTGDYGGLGTRFSNLHDTYTATGEVNAPILQIAKNRGDKEVADATLQQQRARYSDQVQQVNQDVRDALLDIEAARQLVQTARSNVDLANEALSEAQQRFRAGVTDNLAVSEAQAQTQQANDQYISALYQHNVAKLSLARATGTAGTNYKNALQAGGH